MDCTLKVDKSNCFEKSTNKMLRQRNQLKHLTKNLQFLNKTTHVKLNLKPVKTQLRFYNNAEKKEDFKTKEEKEKIFDEELDKKVPEEKGFWTTLFSLWGNLVVRYAMIAGISVIAIYTGYKVWSFFTNLTFEQIGRWSFWAGFWTAASISMAIYVTKRSFEFKATQVYRVALNKVLNDPQVGELLGRPITPSKFKSFGYDFKNGSISTQDLGYINWILNAIKEKIGYQQKYLQMMFQINGLKRMAVVTCEVSKLPGITVANLSTYNFRTLSVEVFHKNQTEKPGTKVVVVLEGKEEDVIRASDIKV
eukprot:gene6563-10726_t